jgi:hypothetical protein
MCKKNCKYKKRWHVFIQIPAVAYISFESSIKLIRFVSEFNHKNKKSPHWCIVPSFERPRTLTNLTPSLQMQKQFSELFEKISLKLQSHYYYYLYTYTYTYTYTYFWLFDIFLANLSKMACGGSLIICSYIYIVLLVLVRTLTRFFLCTVRLFFILLYTSTSTCQTI